MGKDSLAVDLRSDKLEGKKFMLTGSFDGFSRHEMAGIIITNGGELTTSLDSETYLVVGFRSTAKVALTKKHGLFLTQADFFNLLK